MTIERKLREVVDAADDADKSSLILNEVKTVSRHLIKKLLKNVKTLFSAYLN